MNARHPAKRRPLPHLLQSPEKERERYNAVVKYDELVDHALQDPDLVVFDRGKSHSGDQQHTLLRHVRHRPHAPDGARRFCSPLWGLGELFLRFGPRGFGVVLRVAPFAVASFRPFFLCVLLS